jgi:hypothetical protein
MRQRTGEAHVQRAMDRFANNVRPGLARLTQLLAEIQV